MYLSVLVYEVRRTAADLLNSFCDESSNVGIQNVTSRFIPSLLEYYKGAKGLSGSGANYLHRIIFLYAAFGLHSHLEAFSLVSNECVEALGDPVINVRIVACQLISRLGPEEQALFVAKLTELSEDSDIHMASLARQALDG